MSDETPTPFSAEVRLGSGQLARMHEGTVRVIAPKELPTYHFLMNVAHIDQHTEPVTAVRAPNYEALVQFLKQLEKLDYLLLNIERVDGEVPVIN